MRPLVRRRRRTIAPAVLATCLVSVAALASPGAAAAAPAAQRAVAVPGCAWRLQPNPTTSNSGYVDTDAAYWIMPYLVQNGLSIVVRGTYPNARYLSLTDYNQQQSTFVNNGVSSGLTDFQIAPDPGSTNPWQKPAAAGGHFTVTLSSTVSAGTPNVLPIAPQGARAGSLGYLFLRVYLPAGGAGAVSLPSVTFVQGGTSVPVPNCPTVARTASSAVAPVRAAAPSLSSSTATRSAAFSSAITAAFARASTGGKASALSNPNNGYLTAVVRPPGGVNVIVIRAKAPTTPPGGSPLPWPSSAQVRYWSMCIYPQLLTAPVVVNKLPNGSVDYGCRADTAVATDFAGYYTFVIGTEAQRPLIQALPGVTFLPFSTQYAKTAHSLILRNLIGNFPQAVQNVPGNSSPASAAAVMGQYYPQMAVVPLLPVFPFVAGQPGGAR